MISTDMNTFTTLTGSGAVHIIDGDPWLEWTGDDGIIRTRCRAGLSKSTRSGHRWYAYIPGEGHNRTLTVPESCVEAAFNRIGGSTHGEDN